MKTSGESLARRLAAFQDGFFQRLPREERCIVQDATAATSAHARLQRHVQAGEPAPDLTLPDQHDRPLRLSEQLGYGPVILLFVRGSWCPFSALALRSYQEALAAIHDAGGNILAITPEPPIRCSSMAERDLLAFPMLSDSLCAVARAYGVTYDVPPNLRPLYLKWGQDLPRLAQSGTWRIPLPATFVVGRDGLIALADIPLSVYGRLEPTAAIDALRSLRVAA
jgi:peroxiredoxin